MFPFPSEPGPWMVFLLEDATPMLPEARQAAQMGTWENWGELVLPKGIPI